MRIANAGIWAFLMRSAIRFSQIIRVVILGRLLSPSDFGLMAIATITLGLLEVFSQTGYRQALVQREGDIEDSLDTAWSIEIVRGLAVALVVFFGAPLIAMFYNQPEVEPIVRAMASVALISGFTNMAIVQFDRSLRFDLVFRFQVAQRLTEVVVALGVALVWPSVWALVIGAIAGSVARVTASFLLVRRKPRFEIIRAQAARLTSFGKWIYAANILFYLSSEADDVLVGRMLGTQWLGLYRMSYTLSQSVVTEISQTINQVMFPTFSMIQESRQRLANVLVQSTHFVTFLAFPISVVFVVAGEQVVLVLLGDTWLGMVTALKILAVAGAVRAVESVATIMFEGAGQPHLSTRYAAVKLAVMLVSIFPLISWFGIEGAATASLLASVSIMPPILFRVRSFSSETFGEYNRAILWPALNTVLMATAMFSVLRFGPQGSVPGELFLALAVGSVTYLAAVTITSMFFGYRQPRDLIERLGKAQSQETDPS